MRTMNWVQGFFVHKGIISADKRLLVIECHTQYREVGGYILLL
jgi:hypothetical protein